MENEFYNVCQELNTLSSSYSCGLNMFCRWVTEFLTKRPVTHYVREQCHQGYASSFVDKIVNFIRFQCVHSFFLVKYIYIYNIAL